MNIWHGVPWYFDVKREMSLPANTKCIDSNSNIFNFRILIIFPELAYILGGKNTFITLIVIGYCIVFLRSIPINV